MKWISTDDEEIDVGNIDEDEREKHTFEFVVDPTEIDDANYVLVVKAYPKGDESDTCIDHSSDLGESTFGSGSEYFAEITVDKENDKEKMVVIDEDSYPSPINAFCGETVSFDADIYNIGDEDFEDQIKVILVNKELGLTVNEIVQGDLDEAEKTDVVLSFKVPSDAVENNQYILKMQVFYDYDKDDDVYDEVSDETFEALLKVSGNCASGTSIGEAGTASVSAVLESGGKAGEEMVVKATISNKGTTTATYTLNAAAYSTWASSASLSSSVLTLSPGNSEDVLITINVKDSASGDETFNIEVLSGNQLVKTQSVSVLVESKSSGLSFLSSGFAGNNLYLWGLGILNIILILAVVLVVVRLMRK